MRDFVNQRKSRPNRFVIVVNDDLIGIWVEIQSRARLEVDADIVLVDNAQRRPTGGDLVQKPLTILKKIC